MTKSEREAMVVPDEEEGKGKFADAPKHHRIESQLGILDSKARGLNMLTSLCIWSWYCNYAEKCFHPAVHEVNYSTNVH